MVVSVTTPEIRRSNPVMGNINLSSTVFKICKKETKIKRKTEVVSSNENLFQPSAPRTSLDRTKGLTRTSASSCAQSAARPSRTKSTWPSKLLIFLVFAYQNWGENVTFTDSVT